MLIIIFCICLSCLSCSDRFVKDTSLSADNSIGAVGICPEDQPATFPGYHLTIEMTLDRYNPSI